MKTKLLLLSVFLILTVISTHAQSKKDIEDNLNKCTLAKDSIQKSLTGLSAKYDSIIKSFIPYDTMYHVIKDKVLMRDFNPMNMSTLLDSLRKTRNEELSGKKDSLSILKGDNAMLKAKVDSLSNDDAVKTKVVNDLKQLKELLDAKIITQAEFDTKKEILIRKF